MSVSIIVLLIILGLILLILEILVIPGVGVVGIFGAIFIIVAIYGAYLNSFVFGNVTLLLSVILSVLSIYFSLKSSTWQNAKLNAASDSKVVQFNEDEIRVGDDGITVSRLANIGKAKINNKFFEVESSQGFIDVNTPIRVLKIDSNKIIVKQLNSL